MPATVADIAAATRPMGLTFDTQESTAIKTRHVGARDTGENPTPGDWDSLADATVVNAARFALYGVERRRFAVPVSDIDTALTLDLSQVTPTVTLIDARHAANGPVAVTRIEIDLDAEASSFELFGS